MQTPSKLWAVVCSRMKTAHAWVNLGLLGWGLAVLFLGLVWPVGVLFTQGVTSVSALHSPEATPVLWDDSFMLWRILWTLVLALSTSGLCLVLGLPLAWLLTRLQWPLRSVCHHWVMLPMVVPTLVAALGVLAVWGPQGWWAGVLPANEDGQPGPWLLLLGHVFFNLGIVVRAAAQGLQAVSAGRVAAARTLGASAWRAFWRVEWPALLPHLMVGLSLVFLYSFGSFGLPLVLGGQRYATLEVEIYTRVAHDLDLVGARQLAAVSAGLMAMVAFGQTWWGHRLVQPKAYNAPPAIKPTGAWHWVAIALGMAVLSVLCLLPLLAVVERCVASLDSLPKLLAQEDTLLALRNSLVFSFMALCLAITTGCVLAFSAHRFQWLRPALTLPLLVSPVVVGFGYLLAYPNAIAHEGLLISAYALLALPLVALPLLAALDALPNAVYCAARSLGASRWRAFVRITLPQLLPALRRGAALALASCMGEFAITLFLSRPEWTTLGTLIYQYLGRPGQANFEAALLLSGLLLALTGAMFWLIDPPTRKA
jgi:thiamine transport system permease protein